MSSSAMTQFTGGGMPSQLSPQGGAVDPRRVVDAIADAATHDVGVALQTARDVLAADLATDPASDPRDIASAIVAQLDDVMLDALTESPTGRQLLELLYERGGDAAQAERLQHALHGAAVPPGALGFTLQAAARSTRRRSLRPRRA